MAHDSSTSVATLTVDFEPKFDAIIQGLSAIEKERRTIKFDIDDKEIRSKLDDIVSSFEKGLSGAFSNLNIKGIGDAAKTATKAWETELSRLQDRVQNIFNKSGFNMSSGTLGRKFGDIANTKEYADAVKALQALNNLSTSKITDQSQFDQYKKACQSAERALASLANRQKEFNESLSRSRSIENYIKKLNSVRESADKDGRTTELNNLIKRLSDAAKDGSVSIKSLGSEVDQFLIDIGRNANELQSFGNVFSGIFGMSLAQTARRGLRAFAKAVISSVKEVNQSLTEFQIVAGVSDKKLSQFASGAFDTAQRISASFQDVADASTVFRRLGYSVDDSLKLSEMTTMFSRIGDVGISDAEDAATAVLKAFDMTANDLQLAMDKMVKVGNNFPISASQIGEALNNASSALAAGGNNFDQTIALLTAANATVQDASKSSTALRTITARIRNTKAELEDLGEEVDKNYDTTAKYRKELLALADVDILDANDEFRSTYDILADLAKAWETLGSKEKAAITQMVAGTRGLNVFSSLMENFNIAKEVMDDVGTASGFMAERYETYTNSIEAANTRLKNSWDELATHILNSDVVIGVVDWVNGVLQGIDKYLQPDAESERLHKEFTHTSFSDYYDDVKELDKELEEFQAQLKDTEDRIASLQQKQLSEGYSDVVDNEISSLRAESIEILYQIDLLRQRRDLAASEVKPIAQKHVASSTFDYHVVLDTPTLDKETGELQHTIKKTGTLNNAIDENSKTIQTAQTEMDTLTSRVNENAITFEEYTSRMVVWMRIQEEAAQDLASVIAQLDNALPYLSGLDKTSAQQDRDRAQRIATGAADQAKENYENFARARIRDQITNNLIDARTAQSAYYKQQREAAERIDSIGKLRESEYKGLSVQHIQMTDELKPEVTGGGGSSRPLAVLSNKMTLPLAAMAQANLTDTGHGGTQWVDKEYQWFAEHGLSSQIDLLNRPQVHGWEMRRGGYTDFTDEDLATVYSAVYSDVLGKQHGIFTPISQGGEVFTKDFMDQYADRYFSTGEDPRGLLLAVTDNLDDAVYHSELLHKAQAQTYKDVRADLTQGVVDASQVAWPTGSQLRYGVDEQAQTTAQKARADAEQAAVKYLAESNLASTDHQKLPTFQDILGFVSTFFTDTLPNTIDGLDNAIAGSVDGFITDTLPNTIDGLDSAVVKSVDGFVTDTLPNTIDGLDNAIVKSVDGFVTDTLPNTIDGITTPNSIRRAEELATVNDRTRTAAVRGYPQRINRNMSPILDNLERIEFEMGFLRDQERFLYGGSLARGGALEALQTATDYSRRVESGIATEALPYVDSNRIAKETARRRKETETTFRYALEHGGVMAAAEAASVSSTAEEKYRAQEIYEQRKARADQLANDQLEALQKAEERATELEKAQAESAVWDDRNPLLTQLQQTQEKSTQLEKAEMKTMYEHQQQLEQEAAATSAANLKAFQEATDRSTMFERGEARKTYKELAEEFVNSLSDEDYAIAINWKYATDSGRDPIEDLQFYLDKAHEIAGEEKPIEIDIAGAKEELENWTKKRDALNTALSNQRNGALALTDISALGADYATAYTYGAGHMQLDEQAAFDIQHQKSQEVYLTLAKRMLEVTRQEQACRKKIEDLYGDTSDHAQELLKSQQDSLDTLTNQALEIQVMMDQLNEQTSDRAAYTRAKGTANADQNVESMRDSLISDLQAGVKTGGMWVDDYEAAVKYVLGEEADHTIRQGNEAIKKVKRYSAKDGKGYDNAREDLIKAGILDKNGSVAFDLDENGNAVYKTVQQAADALGVSKDYMYDILNMMTKYGAQWDYMDEYWTDMIGNADTLEGKFTTISAALAAGADKDNLINNIVKSAGEGEDAVESLRQSYAAMVKAATEGLSDEDAASMTTQIQESFTKAVGDADIDLSKVFDIEDIDWSSLEPDPITIEIKTNPADPSSLIPGNTSSTHTIYVRTVTTGSRDPDTGYHPSSANFGDLYTGSANVSGTAYMGGKWGSHFGTHKALVGELGQELMVDPNTGKWRTIGDHGPEIITVPDDAIIFNDKQTAGILAGRGVYGRGTQMHYSGTAHLTGMTVKRLRGWDVYDKKEKSKSSGDSGKSEEKKEEKKKDDDLLSDEFKADKEMLETQLDLISDMLNLYHEGTEEWFDQQANIVDTYSKAVKLTQLEYERLLAEGYDASYKSVRELAEQIVDWQNEIFDAQQEYWEAQKENATKTLEHLNSHIDAVVDLKEAHYDLINSIQDEEIALRKEMQIAKDAYPYLTDAERQAALSDEDYAYLLNKLSKISKEASGMYEDYLAQIEEVGEDATWELDRITEQLQIQYDLKMKEYATAKAELGVLKAKKNLENVMMEKNVATLVGGMWVWEADSENVKQAMEELSDAEMEYAKSIREKDQEEDIAALNNYSAEVQAQIDAIDAAIFSMDDLAKEVHDLKDAIWAQILANLSENGKKAVNENEQYYQTFADGTAEALAKLIADNDFTSTLMSAYTANLGRNWDAAQTAAATLGGGVSNTDDHSTTVYIGDVKLDSDTSSAIITALRQANALYQV